MQRGCASTNAPAWSEAAALVVLEDLRASASANNLSLDQTVANVLSSESQIEAFVRRLGSRLSAGDKEVVGSVLNHHRTRDVAQATQLNTFLKPLRQRMRQTKLPQRIGIVADRYAPLRVSDILSQEPMRDRMRDIRKGKRTWEGLQTWPLGWLREPGVVCYERANGRIRIGGGKADPSLVRALVQMGCRT